MVRVAYLVNPDNVGTLDVLAELKLAAPAAGMAPIGVEFGSATDFDAALAMMLRERTEVLLVSNGASTSCMSAGSSIFWRTNRIAGMFQTKENVAAGGFMPTGRVCPMSYGASVPDLFRRAASYVHRILRGAKPLTCRWSCRRDFDLATGRERISLQVESGQTPEAVHVQKMVYELE